MALHDAVFDSLTLDSDRRLRLTFSEIPGRTGERLTIEFDGYQCVVMVGTIEKDWFLSGVYCYGGDGAAVDPFALEGTLLSRLVTLGTNGAAIEVMAGRATTTVNR